MMMKCVLSLTLLLLATNASLADSPGYIYFRSDNFDHSTPISTTPVCMDKCDISGLCSDKKTCAELTEKYSCSEYYAPGKSYAGWCDKTCGVCGKTEAPTVVKDPSARQVDWNSTYRLFDSPRDVRVTRYDFFDASTDLRLGGEKAFLSLPEGAAYIFTTSPLLVLRDVVNPHAIKPREYSIYAESVAWAAKGSCLQLDVGRNVGGNVSVVIVSSGMAELTTKDATCKTAIMKVGSDELHNNPVDYVANGTCDEPLAGPGGADDYDDLDAPIGPLRAHYHTRGALYYTAAGSSFYNDGDAVPYSIQSGELRFVQQGVYYGPETMWDDAYVMSFHEPDPSARYTGNVTTPTGFNPCSFACCDDPGSSRGAVTCVAPGYDL